MVVEGWLVVLLVVGLSVTGKSLPAAMSLEVSVEGGIAVLGVVSS